MPIFAPKSDPSSPFASMRGDHAGVRVPDFDSAAAWYSEKLDFRLTARTKGAGLTWAFMAPPNDLAFQIELAAGPGIAGDGTSADLGDSFSVGGIHHIALQVGRLEPVLEELRLRGVNVIAGPIEFAEIKRRGAFFQDPWGNLFELTEDVGEPAAKLGES